MSNLEFLFAGFLVVWVLLAGYMFSLSSRQKKLSREVEMLKEQQGKK